MNQGRVGYDLDGIICHDPRGITAKLLNTPFFYAALRWHQSRAKLLSAPETDAVIITSRLQDDAERTRRWLRRHKIHNLVIHNPWKPEDGVKWKRAAIILLNVTTYLESDLTTAQELRTLLPKVKIICPTQLSTEPSEKEGKQKSKDTLQSF